MALMLAMKHKKLDMMLYYDAGYVSISAYGGFFAPATFAPSNVYYAFKAFGELYALGGEVECTCDKEGVYSLAATDGEKKSVIISNVKEAVELETSLSDEFSVYVIDVNNHFTKTEWSPRKFTLPENTVAVVKNF